ncbi:MAG: hypothetical protein ACK6BN_15725 [Pseudanabaena sp.]|nr:hypothetical protein [Pseudanabaena sp. M109S1SP1A06QC]MCA6613537.1 hypothetical protein [Pseudanabaena sp. M090S1SP1A06QC]
MKDQQNFLYGWTKFCLENAQYGVETLGTKLSCVMENSCTEFLVFYEREWLHRDLGL